MHQERARADVGDGGRELDVTVVAFDGRARRDLGERRHREVGNPRRRRGRQRVGKAGSTQAPRHCADEHDDRDPDQEPDGEAARHGATVAGRPAAPPTSGGSNYPIEGVAIPLRSHNLRIQSAGQYPRRIGSPGEYRGERVNQMRRSKRVALAAGLVSLVATLTVVIAGAATANHGSYPGPARHTSRSRAIRDVRRARQTQGASRSRTTQLVDGLQRRANQHHGARWQPRRVQLGSSSTTPSTSRRSSSRAATTRTSTTTRGQRLRCGPDAAAEQRQPGAADQPRRVLLRPEGPGARIRS